MISIGTTDGDENYPKLHEACRRTDAASLRIGDGETLASYIRRSRETVELLSQLHINIQGGYYSHKNPAGCFNCKSLVQTCELIRALELVGTIPEEQIQAEEVEPDSEEDNL